MDLVQHGAWWSGWSRFLLVILIVFSVLLLDLSSHSGLLLGFGLSCLTTTEFSTNFFASGYDIYFACLTSNILFVIFVVIYSSCVFFPDFSTVFIFIFAGPKFFAIVVYLSGFSIYILTSVIVYLFLFQSEVLGC